MLQKLTIPASIALILATGTVYGIWIERWGASTDLQEATARLSQIPSVVGDWVGSDFEKTSVERLIRDGTVTGMVSRQYRNRQTGEVVALLAVCGRPGPIATHTPEICYGNMGYVAASTPKPWTVPNGDAVPAELWLGHFNRPEAAVPDSLVITWSWRAAGAQDWKAVDNPRLAFAPYRALYKIYVVRQASPEDSKPDQAQCLDFLRALLPRLEMALFEAPGKQSK